MKHPRSRIRHLLKLALIFVLLGLIAYLGVVAMVCWKEAHVPVAEEYDAIIVLGAQVKPDGVPSLQLQWRLDAAAQAYQKNPCIIVTCGAQGSNEPAPEALVMRDYLVGQGVPQEMILPEPDSYNTRQNIANAAALLEEHDVHSVVVVTSDYHLPRAMAIAEDQGLTASGIGAPTKLGFRFWVKNHGREALAWIKYWGQKYLHLPLE
ncbi:MAG: YdcF family protein [Clostridia bacterium]|nr:YdcF family protein [Clostridia bacterium]